MDIVRDRVSARATISARRSPTGPSEDSDELIAEFRNSPELRIAVTVDQIATGTDIKPLECLLFMRDVRSRGYFEQMLGRGVRVINNADFRAVTPDATSKERFVVVDAVASQNTIALKTEPSRLTESPRSV